MKNTGPVQRTTASSAAGSEGVQAAPDEQHGTRNKVARSILDHGPSTAAELAERLELTQAAVRRHLDTLVGEGVVESRAQRVYGARGRGRPAKVFALTDCGRDAFDQAYDELATDAMRWIARVAGGGEVGEAAVAEFARARVWGQVERFRQRVEQAAPEERTRVLAEALTEDGYAATARGAPASIGEQLCQHHCPVVHAAEEFPQLCEAETEVFSHLLGTHVQRLATIAHGDGVCTTFVPHAGQPAEQLSKREARAQRARSESSGSVVPQKPQKPQKPPGQPGPRRPPGPGQKSDQIASASTAGRNPV